MACFVAKLDTLLSLDFGKTSGGHFCGWFSLTKNTTPSIEFCVVILGLC
jgi:hypothetical protein